MKLFLIIGLFILGTQCFGMELQEFDIQHNANHQAPIEVKRWTDSLVHCIEKRKKAQVIQLLEHLPTNRSRVSLNDKIMEEIKAHRDEQFDAMHSPCSAKRVWNKIRAISIDLGLPITVLALGITDGIIAERPVIIALSAVYFVLSLESAFKQTYTHWTMKEYEDKIEEFDVWLQVMHGMQQLQEKGEGDQLQPLTQNNNNKTE